MAAVSGAGLEAVDVPERLMLRLVGWSVRDRPPASPVRRTANPAYRGGTFSYA